MGPVVSLLICGGPKMDSSQDDADAARRPELPHPKKTMAAAERKVDTERIFMAESCCLFRESEIDLLSMDELCSLTFNLDIKISSSRQNILGKKIDFLACDCEVICRFAFAGHSTSEPHQPLAPPPSQYQAKHGVLLLSVRPALLAVHSCCGNCYLHRCIGICQSESG